MCIGMPMQVLLVEPGHAVCTGRGETQRVDTALVGDCAPGDWLLVFLGSAREPLDASRAAEINAALDLLALGVAGAAASPGFDLPSALSAEQLAALTGATPNSQSKEASR